MVPGNGSWHRTGNGAAGRGAGILGDHAVVTDKSLLRSSKSIFDYVHELKLVAIQSEKSPPRRVSNSLILGGGGHDLFYGGQALDYLFEAGLS